MREKREALPKIKLCGLSRPCDIRSANELRPDYAGFVFAPKSRRYVSPKKALELKGMLDKEIQAVGVFVDEDPRIIAGLVRQGVIDLVQLHGREDERYIRELRQMLEETQVPGQRPGGCERTEIIKAFSIASGQDAERAQRSGADVVLVDSGCGGTGEAFDWSLLKKIRRPYFLAGGLNAGNVGDAVRKLKPYGVDVSSGIETDGSKDRKKMKEFVCAVRSAAE